MWDSARRYSLAALGAALAVVLGLAAPPGAAATLEDAITQGTPSLDLRLRYEHAEQDNGLTDGNALTARARLGYRTAQWNGFDALAEYEGVYAIGGDDSYNSGAAFLDATNGRTGHVTIADPTGNELNRAWLRYRGFRDTAIKAGRQRIILDNSRFVGNVGWRDNEQTFDAAEVVSRLLPDTTVTYAYLWRQDYIFFNRNKLDAHLINLHWAACKALAITGYAYLIDFDNDSAPRVPGNPDQKTFGARATGALGPVGYALEYANQSHYADSPSTVKANFFAATLSWNRGPVVPTLGFQKLGGDGRYGFAFPLGTNHKFQGWADVFLTTPNTGVRDAYAQLVATVAKTKLTAVYHNFSADSGGGRYGGEVDLSAGRPVTQHLGLLLTFADYNADGFAVDTRRYWVQASYAF